MSLKLISINVRGIGDVIKRRAIFNFYRQRAEIICLQETHSYKEIEEIWSSEWQGDILFSHGSRKSRGICFLLPKGTMKYVTNIRKDSAGRILKFDLQKDKMCFTICGIYAPNSDTPSYFKDIQAILSEGTEHKILIGDFQFSNGHKQRPYWLY